MIKAELLEIITNGGLVHIEKLPVSGTSIKDLDLRRFEYYLERIIEDNVIPKSSHHLPKTLGRLQVSCYLGKNPGIFYLMPDSGLPFTPGWKKIITPPPMSLSIVPS
jgi:hypothetical protein